MKFFNVKQLLVVAIAMGSITSIMAVNVNDILNDSIQTIKDLNAVKTGDVSACEPVVKDLGKDLEDLKSLLHTFKLSSVADQIPTIDHLTEKLATELGVSKNEIRVGQIADYLFLFLTTLNSTLKNDTIKRAIAKMQDKITNCSQIAYSQKQLEALLD